MPDCPPTFDIVSDPNMTGNPHLAGQNYVPTYLNTARYADLSNNKGVLAHYHIMCNLNQIIDFCSALDPGFSQCRPINSAVCTYFNIIVNLNNPYLRNLYMSGFILCITETIASDNCSTMDNDAIPQSTTA